MSYLRDRLNVLAALGAGVLVGGGGVFLYFKLTRSVNRELLRLSAVVGDLRREVIEIKEKLFDSAGNRRSTSSFSTLSRRNRGSGYFSVHASSGEDDVYEEATEGSSDLDSNRDYRTPEARSPTPGLAGVLFSNNLSNSEFYAEVDKYLDGSDADKEQAYQALQNRQLRCISDPEFLWRLSKACYLMAGIEGDRENSEKKKQLMFESKDHSTSAIQLNEDCASAHKWLACSLGAVAEYGGTQERIKSAYVIRDHMQRAIDLNPSDPTAHYLLGRWCLGVYMLTWIERKVAATLFGSPPTSTVEEALEHFIEAEKLKPNQWKENMLFISKCYIEMRDIDEAVKWLEKASSLPTISTDHRNIQVEVDSLLVKHRI